MMGQDPRIDRASPAELAELAAFELDRGHYDAGEEALEQAVLTEPFSAAVARVLEQAFRRSSGTGRQRLRDAVLRHPSIALGLALTAFDNGDTDQALEWCAALMEQRYPDALILQSLILQTRGDYQGALQAADQYVALETRSPNGYLRRAAVHTELGDEATMKGDTEASRSAYERALADYDNALRLAPDLVDALLNRARVLGRMGETALALDAYAGVLAVAPSLAEAYAERGALHQANGDYRYALADYEAWIESAPGNAHAYRNRAAVHAALGRREQAIADYDRALELSPDLQQARLERAQLRVAEGQLPLALRDYDEVLDRDPDFVAVRGTRGDLLVTLGDRTGLESQTTPTDYYRRALDDYGAVTNLSPDLAEPYFKRGVVQARLNDYGQALTDFETAISLDPTHFEAHLRRGDALAHLKDNFRALSSYSQAARLDKRSPNARLGIALAHLGLGDSYSERRSFEKMYEEFEAAISAGDEALRLTRKYATDDDQAGLVALARSHQGRALRGLEDYDHAITAFAEAAAAAATSQPRFHAALIADQGETVRLWGVLAEQPAKLSQAVLMLQAAVDAHPARADLGWIQYAKGSALVDLAWYHGDLAQYDEALHAFDAALEADRAHGWAHIGKGKAHYLRGNRGAAVSSFNEALALDTDAYRTWAEVGVGLVLRQQARETEADNALQRAIGTAHSARSYLDRADILEYFYAWQLAERDRLRAAMIKPESADSQGALAWSYIQYQPTPERLTAAIEIAQKAVDNSRGRAMRAANLDSVAWAYHKLGNHERAVQLLEQATQLDSHHVLIRAHLQEAQAALDPEEALGGNFLRTRRADVATAPRSLTRQEAGMPAETIVLNGISGETGSYLVPPLEPSRIAALVKGEATDQGLVRWLARVWRRARRLHLGLPMDVDPTDVSQAGWAIVFSTDEPQEIRDALGPLIEHRQALCGEHRTKVLDIRPGENWQEWLERHGDAIGNVTPTKVPFYLLLAGSPERISYENQYLLSVERAVGRLHFDSVDGYTCYVQSLIDHEQGRMPPRARVAAFLGTRHDFDAATQLSADLLVRPLAYGTPGLAAEPAEPGVADRRGFTTRAFIQDSATKANLAELLHGTVGGEAIAFAFTATHGMGWPADSANQQAKQGALLSQDWSGIGSINASQYLTAAEISDDAHVQGMILFHFACYGAGTPRYDNFLHEPGQPPPVVADQAFVAALPKRMLSHPNGAALAVIGHVERAWGCSFVSQASEPQLLPFRNAIGRILTQAPVGYAMRDFREKYAALSTNLSSLLQSVSYGAHIGDDELADAWLERNDAQNYTVTGDPAVRLRIPDPAES